MAHECSRCGLSFRREPGFYLGSIYINYGTTVIATGLLYAGMVMGLGWSHGRALAICLAVAVVFPVWFFRYARAFLLSLDQSVNGHQSGGAAAGQAESSIGPERLAQLKADDGNAGCMMGIVLALILAFGLLMGAVTLSFVARSLPPAPL